MDKTMRTLIMKDEQSYKELIDLAQETGVFKACGNPDNRWVMLAWVDEKHFTGWQEYHFGRIFM